MGFFDKLLKQVGGEILDSVTNSVSHSISDSVTDAVTDALKGNDTQTVDSTSIPTTSATTQPSVQDRIIAVINSEYTAYSLEYNVAATKFGGSAEAAPISYVLCLNGSPKLGILVLSGKVDYKKQKFILAHEACKQAGFNCINIMTYLPSTTEYIKEAIAKNI